MRALRPGGLFLFQDQVTPEDVDAAGWITRFERRRDPSDHRALSAAEWLRLLGASGLSVEGEDAFEKRLDLVNWVADQDGSAEDLAELRAWLRRAPAAELCLCRQRQEPLRRRGIDRPAPAPRFQPPRSATPPRRVHHGRKLMCGTVGGDPVMAALMTIFEADVLAEDSAELQSRWRELTRNRPPQVMHSWLVRGLDGGDTWCSIAVWPDLEALDEYRATVDAPPAIKSFHSVAARPEFAVFKIVAEG